MIGFDVSRLLHVMDTQDSSVFLGELNMFCLHVNVPLSQMDGSQLLLHAIAKKHTEVILPLLQGTTLRLNDFMKICNCLIELDGPLLIDDTLSVGWNRFGTKMYDEFWDGQDRPFMHEVMLSALTASVRCGSSEMGQHIITNHIQRHNIAIPSSLLAVAAFRGMEDMVDVLLPHCDPNDYFGNALNNAIQFGYEGIVSKLLPVTKTLPDHDGLDIAVLKSSDPRDMLHLLLPHYSSARINGAFCTALRHHGPEVWEVIYPYADVMETLNMLRGDRPQWEKLRQFHAEKQHQELTQEVDDNSVRSPRASKM